MHLSRAKLLYVAPPAVYCTSIAFISVCELSQSGLACAFLATAL